MNNGKECEAEPTLRLSDNPGLYIHVPFCIRKCRHCHFYSIDKIELIPDFIKALQKEMYLSGTDFKSVPELPFDTIYFGGGTPSLLDSSQFETILSTIRRHYCIAPHPEITVEINPADRDTAWFRGLRQAGVNRLNIGVQSFDDRILRFLGRRHSAAESITSIETAAKTGFDNIGLDLIYGIPGQSLSLWQKTLAKALSFHPAHLSCYEFSIEEDTPLMMNYKRGDFVMPDEDRQWDLFRITS
ncbi:MAG: coproporphyrinogen-III oxidase family protein, partial [Syntrophales bacterium]|nr:coproporphyrinogen-III oxidase family protein [Syntrophales bacterium]